MTIHDEVILGAAQLRRQIKVSGGLKMDEFGCTDNTGEAHANPGPRDSPAAWRASPFSPVSGGTVYYLAAPLRQSST